MQVPLASCLRCHVSLITSKPLCSHHTFHTNLSPPLLCHTPSSNLHKHTTPPVSRSYTTKPLGYVTMQALASTPTLCLLVSPGNHQEPKTHEQTLIPYVRLHNRQHPPLSPLPTSSNSVFQANHSTTRQWHFSCHTHQPRTSLVNPHTLSSSYPCCYLHC